MGTAVGNTINSPEVAAIRRLLEGWAERTRTGQLEHILDDHAEDALIYDMLPPLKYEGTEAYRRSWGDWHPDTPDEGRFELQDLSVIAGEDEALAQGSIQCGGPLALDGPSPKFRLEEDQWHLEDPARAYLKGDG
ncbi:YybH family protein [Granulicella sibirica]|uniref:SnoaL-like domain-containing protein n=1 Tax=Granulicella sibirica TaxID=2479048 RepID=A0A4Q0SXV2_9BACT|nr:nuclear transport factor 2 family protein [Granulicella sibirica]RXH55993.1 hypothetical protein GRAN_2850 [Granulicella sibirica]